MRNNHPRLLAIILLVLAMVLVTAEVRAEQVEITVAGDPPIKIWADQVTAYENGEIYEGEGHIKVLRGTEVIKAQNARVHVETNTAELRGGVVLLTSDFEVNCERLVVNFDLNIGKIYNGTVFFPLNHYYVSGDEIERTGVDTFLVVEGRATSCDGPSPDWKLTGRNISIEREGFATAEHATFTIKNFPLLYAPWLIVPVKTRRQSGFLIPSVSHSTRDGFTYAQPIYWAISDSKDMTLYLTYLGKRGVETSVEFRYNDWGGKGSYRVSYLDDQDPPDIVYPNPIGPKSQKERYWVRGMSDARTKNGFDVKVNLDYVSDPDYLEEFKRSIAGFEDTRSGLLEEFGRDLAEPLDPLRTSIFQTTKVVRNHNIKLGVEYTDDLDDPDNRGTYQRLPRIGLDVTRKEIPGTPLFFEGISEYTYFARRSDDNTPRKEQGHRLDFHPRVYLPIKISNYLDIEPYAGFRETIYYPHRMYKDPNDPNATDRDYTFQSRELFDGGVSVSANLSRVYGLSRGPVRKLKHRIKPEISFSLVTHQGQDELPYWDSTDRIPEEQRITYGLSNYLVAKIRTDPEQFKARKGKRGQKSSAEAKVPEYSYAEFLRVGVFRSYDFLAEQREVIIRGLDGPRDIRRPHSPWAFELEANVNPYFWAQAKSEYDTYADMFTDHSLEMRTQDRRGDYIYAAYELHKEPHLRAGRQKNQYEEIRGLLNVALNREWAFQFDNRYSLKEKESIETLLALNYQPQCWGLRLEYMESPGDTSVAVFFTLRGLGEIGSYRYTKKRLDPPDDS